MRSTTAPGIFQGISQRTRRRVGDAGVLLVEHARYFYEKYVSNKSTLAAEFLLRVRTLYAIEAEVRGHPAEDRQTVRQERGRPIVEALHDWLHDLVKRI